MDAEQLARRFVLLGAVNGVLLTIFTIPILIPNLCIATPPGLFGCKATMDINWPGTWVLIAWIVFGITGVFGSLFWGGMYYFRARFNGKTSVSKGLGWLHLLLYNIGVYGATGMMAAIGYVGGAALARGEGVAVASTEIANMLPSLSSDPNSVLNSMPPVVEAAFIGLTVLGALVGFISVWRTKAQSSN